MTAAMVVTRVGRALCLDVHTGNGRLHNGLAESTTETDLAPDQRHHPLGLTLALGQEAELEVSLQKCCFPAVNYSSGFVNICEYCGTGKWYLIFCSPIVLL